MPIRVLCVHGVNTDDHDPQWKADWTAAIGASIRKCNPAADVAEPVFLAFDDLFKTAPLPPQESLAAFLKLGASWLSNKLGDLFHPSRGLEELPAVVRWTAGMVVQWSEDESLRKQLGDRLEQAIRDAAPDLICAHSLGSLFTYDTLVTRPALAQDRTFIAFGSQIGNPAVRSTYMAGRLVPIPNARHFFHLYNSHDPVLTYRFSLDAPDYAQVETTFDHGGLANHDPVGYLTHPATQSEVWPVVSGGAQARLFQRATKPLARLAQRHRQRALLVGINRYPDPANQLEGCVNDTYRVSEMLQEHGFAAEGIRVLLDERATTAAFTERLDWLLEGVQPGDQRVLFYSGHGAQLPAYGPGGVVDRVDECLVPVDFDWTPEHAITDQAFCARYSQLPYDCRFVTIFDCCHSGGMARAGGARVRGLTPPDDIRHRLQEWDAGTKAWRQRDLGTSANRNLFESTGPGAARRQRYFGGSPGTFYPLGRAAHLRWMSDARRDAARKRFHHAGPYLPTLLTACGANQLSYEYRQGSASYGAFTYVFTELVRQSQRRGHAEPNVTKLVGEAATRLQALGYQQTPGAEGPRGLLRRPLPW